MESVESVYDPTERDALVQKKPIQRRRDALCRSTFHWETSARDILIATGSHPTMERLNSHLDILRNTFRAVNPESDLSIFMWDPVDVMQDSKKEPEREPRQLPKRQIERVVEPETSASNACVAKKIKWKQDIQRSNDLPISFPSQLSTRPVVLNKKDSLQVIMPNSDHFGTMSTIFSTAFNRGLSARFMSKNEEVWAAVFTVLEWGFRRPDCTIQAIVGKDTSEVIGWVGCHEVDSLQAWPEHPSAYMDWFTAAHFLPSQLSRFTPNEGSGNEKAERSQQREGGQKIASTIQTRATRAQDDLVSIHRLVVNAPIVHPLHQGRGIAFALLKSITETIHGRGKEIQLDSGTGRPYSCARGV